MFKIPQFFHNNMADLAVGRNNMLYVRLHRVYCVWGMGTVVIGGVLTAVLLKIGSPLDCDMT